MYNKTKKGKKTWKNVYKLRYLNIDKAKALYTREKKTR